MKVPKHEGKQAALKKLPSNQYQAINWERKDKTGNSPEVSHKSFEKIFYEIKHPPQKFGFLRNAAFSFASFLLVVPLPSIEPKRKEGLCKVLFARFFLEEKAASRNFKKRKLNKLRHNRNKRDFKEIFLFNL